MKNNMKFRTALFLALALTIAVLTIDLVSKYLIELYLPNIGDSASFLPGFINFVVVHNNGAAWNSFAGMQVLLIILTSLVLALFIVFFALRYKRNGEKTSKLLAVAFGFVVGSSLGNLFDRIAFGYVRDFLNFEFMSFPVFNLADTFVCIGMILLVIYFIFFFDKEGKSKKEKNKKIINDENKEK